MPTNWSKIDWSLSNQQIARRENVPPETVVAMRASMRQGRHHTMTSTRDRVAAVASADKTARAIAAACGLSRNKTLCALRHYGLPFKHAPTRVLRETCIDWSRVDWRLRDTDIARILGLSVSRVNGMRLENNMPPSDFKRKIDVSPSELSDCGVADEVVSALIAMKRAADAWLRPEAVVA